jgi:flagellar motility protein MotE (MotC chaperone)
MDVEDAANEFFTWGTYQQVDCLAALDTRTAAGILQRMDPEKRKEVVSMMEPYVAANIVQVGTACNTPRHKATRPLVRRVAGRNVL